MIALPEQQDAMEILRKHAVTMTQMHALNGHFQLQAQATIHAPALLLIAHRALAYNAPQDLNVIRHRHLFAMGTQVIFILHRERAYRVSVFML